MTGFMGVLWGIFGYYVAFLKKYAEVKGCNVEGGWPQNGKHVCCSLKHIVSRSWGVAGEPESSEWFC